MYFQSLGKPGAQDVLWAHGWGRSGADFYNMADALSTRYHHRLLDLPGHGRTPCPEEAWDTADYADAVVEWMDKESIGQAVWVGHSFGCRVGLRSAAKYPQRLKALVLVAAAGLKRESTLIEQLQYQYRTRSYKILRAFTPESGRDALRKRYGSADYLNAGDMRDIFLKTIAEDQSHGLPHIGCPVRLFFGSADTETPPEIGRRMQALIPNAQLQILDGMTHWDVLTRGSAQVTKSIVDLIENQTLKAAA